MTTLNLVWDCLFPFIFIFEKFFFFYVISTRNASRTVGRSASMGNDREEREELLRSPFEIGTKEEEEKLNGEEEGEEDSQEFEMNKMKEALSKMEENWKESQQRMGGVITLL